MSNKDDIRAQYPDEINLQSPDYEAGWNNALAHAASLQQDQQRDVEQALAADREAALRDVFAAAALSGMVAADRGAHSAPVIAREAYFYADAMLAVRKVGR